MNIKDLFNRIATRCSIRPIEAFSSVNDSRKYRLVKTCFEDTVNDMLQRRDWPQLEKTYHLQDSNLIGHYDQYDNHTQNLSQAQYSRFRFPSDYLRPPINQGTLYNRDDYLIGIPITNQVDWAVTADFGFSYPEKFRINPEEQYIDVIPVFSTTNQSENLSLFYISRNWLKHPNGSYSDKFPSDSDYQVILDHEVIYYGTVGRYYRHQKWQDPEYMALYESKMQQKHSNSKPKRRLKIGGKVDSYARTTYYPLSKLNFGR